MKFKYTGKMIKTVNYADNKYLYLFPGKECEISNKDFESERIQKLIKKYELKIIPVVVEAPLKIDIPLKKENKDIIKEAIKKNKKKKKRSNIRKKIKNMLSSKKGGK